VKGLKLTFDWTLPEDRDDFWVVMYLGDTELGRIRYDEYVDLYGDGGTTPEEAVIETVRTLFFGPPEKRTDVGNRRFVRSE
jgi:hypothetical protein